MILNYVFYINIVEVSNNKTIAKDGLISFNDWDSTEHPIIDLKGEWVFYPNTLTNEINNDSEPVISSVPHLWDNNEFTYGTYQLSITGLKPHTSYGFYIQDEFTAYNLISNGELIASNGVVSSSIETSKPQWIPRIGVIHTDENGEILLRMEISNFVLPTGGFRNTIKLGQSDELFNYYMNRNVIETVLLVLIFFISILFLMLYYKNKNKRA